MELEDARAAIDGWFRDRSVEDATALDAFRVVALSERTSADELGRLRLQFVDYLVETRHLDRAAAVRIASVRMDSWFAGAKQAGDPDAGTAPSIVRAATRVIVYALFAAAVAWVVVRLVRGDGFAVSPWFWVVEIVGSIAIASVIAYRAPEPIIPAVYALVPVGVAAVLVLAGA
jgi:hypothetical protein